MWATTVAVAVLFLILQYSYLARRPHEPTIRRSVVEIITAAVIALVAIVVLGLNVGAIWAVDLAGDFLTQYSLSMDVAFVLVVVTSINKVPRAYQDLALALASTIALLLRGGMVAAGWAVTSRWGWAVFISGAIVFFRAVQIGVHVRYELAEWDQPRRLPIVTRLLRRILPISEYYNGPRLTTRVLGRWFLTPFVPVIGTLAMADMLFVPEPGHPYIQFLAVVLSLLMLRPLYFLFRRVVAISTSRTLGRVLGFILILVSVKMLVLGLNSQGINRIHIQMPDLIVPLSGQSLSLWLGVLGAVLTTLVLSWAVASGRDQRMPSKPRRNDARTEARKLRSEVERLSRQANDLSHKLDDANDRADRIEEALVAKILECQTLANAMAAMLRKRSLASENLDDADKTARTFEDRAADLPLPQPE